MKPIAGTAYEVDSKLLNAVQGIGKRVAKMRQTGALTPEALNLLRNYFRIKNIYHSNAIEGNTLNAGETRLVVEQGLTLTGKPLKDQAEAKNLSEALGFLEELAANPARAIVESDLRQIHALVLKGIADAEAGRYRAAVVAIGGSRFKPPAPESVPAEMEAFGRWLQGASVPGKLFANEDALLAASAAHTWFVTIHPFIDGNGRVSRLLMNLLLMRYGYPIAVIGREDRLRYYDALEISQTSDLTPFISLVSECIEESLEEYEAATAENRAGIEWARSIGEKLDLKERAQAANKYAVWRNAMELLKSICRQSADLFTASAQPGEIDIRDFGTLEFEKYLSLANYGSSKKTWFFRMDFRIGSRASRYLFFFGSPSSHFEKGSVDVTLHISREEPAGSFQYERLDALTSPDVPNIVEVGYHEQNECFVTRGANDRIREEKVESLCRRFVEEVIGKHFAG